MCLSDQAVQFATGWEDRPNRRFGVALAMRHRLSGLSTYGLNGNTARFPF